MKTLSFWRGFFICILKRFNYFLGNVHPNIEKWVTMVVVREERIETVGID